MLRHPSFLFGGGMDVQEIYYTTRWEHFRKKILRRDKYLCQICKRYGRMREATEVHHIEHVEDAPEKIFDADNVISLCHACHNRQHPEKIVKATASKAREKYFYG